MKDKRIKDSAPGFKPVSSWWSAINFIALRQPPRPEWSCWKCLKQNLSAFLRPKKSKLETFASTSKKILYHLLSSEEEEVLMPESWGCFAGSKSFHRKSFSPKVVSPIVNWPTTALHQLAKGRKSFFLKVPMPGGEPGIFLVFHLFSLTNAAP